MVNYYYVFDDVDAKQQAMKSRFERGHRKRCDGMVDNGAFECDREPTQSAKCSETQNEMGN